MKQHRYFNVLAAGAAALLTALFAPGWQGWPQAWANATVISTQPIFVSPMPAGQVKPNIMLVLDDSGSMGWDYMPDVVSNFDVDRNGNKLYGFPSSQCNGIYYNPNIIYTPPVDAAGVSYANSAFTNAAKDGYNLGAGYTDLSTSFRAFSADTAQPAYYYRYSGTQSAESKKKYYDTASAFYKECTSIIGSTTAVDGTNPVNTVFTRVLVSATSGPGGTDERTNFANWYSYYRIRMLMMKTATGLAFKGIDANFRVGFMSINNNASPAFLNVSDFTTAQKTTFYSKLYASTTGSSTPLREALADVGRMYAGKISTLNSSTVVDPVQYSCQQNYTILSTDGFWNGTDSNVKKLDGTTTMDNQDGSLPRPFFDGANTTTTKVTPYTSTKDYPTTTTTTTTTIWTKTTTVVGSACTTTVSGTQTAPMNVGNSRTGALGLGSSSPDGNRCTKLGSGSGANIAWFCRSTTNGTLAVSSSSVTDSTGVTWLLATVAGNTGCQTANAAFGSSYSSTVGACPQVSGNTVTQTPYTQTQTQVSSTTTLDQYTANQTTTQTITNGVEGPVGPLSPSSPTYTKTSTLNTTSSSSDTCGGVAAPCPSDTGTWTAGTTTTACVPTASVPTAGTTTPTAGTPTTVNNSSTGAVVATTGPTAGTPTTTTTSSGGTSNTLADVAAYYYYTKLRTTALNNCSPATALNNLCVGGPVATATDPATWQHMTTFTVGLGVRGRMVYSPTYPQDAGSPPVAGDFTDIAFGNSATSPTTCTWRDALTTAGAACNWPVPGADKIENVDDLWHAAVNGHGMYYSATDPAKLSDGLAKTLKHIIDQPKPGTAASAATTNPKVTQNNNYQFSSFFLSVEWSGDLIRQTKDLNTGLPPVFDLLKREPGTYDWSARDQLDAKPYASRAIYTKGPSGMIPFTWADLSAAGLQSYFTTPNISTAPPAYPNQLTGLTQFCATSSNCLSTVAQSNTTIATGGAGGEALVNFLRGDRSNEEGTVTDPTKFFRRRMHVLGDIVSAQPQYSGAPKWSYSDSGYTDYKTLKANRLPLVFAAGNDGMLHAFDAATGAEVWAYIPSFVLPRLYTLADKNYSDKHQYFVEGTPQIGDICPLAPPATCTGSQWKTILVGGLNGGGTGYYALDITNPNSPQLLWEFTAQNMGYTFGNPQITKMDDGSWVVLVTSGYNNCPKQATTALQDCALNAAGDGQGRLYVLNAGTGALLQTIANGDGTASAPSGLSKIVAHEDATNVTRRVYGGDLNGNLWRFTIGSAGYSAFKLATLKNANNVAQPVMDKPQVTTINTLPVVYLGTGRYLSTQDVGVTPAPMESFYAVKDPLTNTFYGSPRTSTNFIQLQAVDGFCPGGTSVAICNPGDPVRTIQQVTGSATDSLINKSGWFLDFPSGAGELEFTDPKLVLGTITFTTSIPSVPSTTDVCRASENPAEGTSFIYMLDYLNGGVVGSANGVAGSFLGYGIATSPQYSQLQDGSVIITTRMSGGNDVFSKARFNSRSNVARRVSWRELVND